MQKRNLPLALALIGGAVGLGLRRWQLATGFEPDTGLPIPGAPAYIALLAFSALMALALVALLRPQKGSWSYDVAFAARENQLYMACVTLGAFLLLGSGVLELLDFPAAYAAAREAEANGVRLALVLPPLRILSCLLGAGCTLFIGANGYKAWAGGRRAPPAWGCACFSACGWSPSTRSGPSTR